MDLSDGSPSDAARFRWRATRRGAMRAKAVYRASGTFVGAAAMVAIVPNLVDAPELTTLAIMLWVALCVFVSLLDRTPRS
jgi:uncharacterized membrane protein YccC